MKTLTDLFKANTWEFEYEEYGLVIVPRHKISYKTIQALTSVLTDINFNTDGDVNMANVTSIIMGVPDPKTRAKLMKSLTPRYDRKRLEADVVDFLRRDRLCSEEEIPEITTQMVESIEGEVVAALFAKFLEYQNLGDNTPR